MCISYTNCTDIMQTNIRIRGPSEPEVERQRAFGARSQGFSSTGTISDDGSGTKKTQQPQQIVNFCAFSRGCVFPRKIDEPKIVFTKGAFCPLRPRSLPNCGARCAQDSSEDGFVRTETRKLSKKKFPSPLTLVWDHLRQEVSKTARRTDLMKKVSDTIGCVAEKTSKPSGSSLGPVAVKCAPDRSEKRLFFWPNGLPPRAML